MEGEMQIEKQRSNKIKVEHEGGGFLPEDIVREILSKLPVKSLLRYMSVSRHWKSLISNNSFKKLHRQKTINKNNPPLLLVLHYSNKDTYVLTTFDLYGKVIQEWSFSIISSTSCLNMLPFPSQSKLVCFVNNERFYLCNPSTRRIIHFPDLLYEISYVCGFAYVPPKDEYVILYLVKSDLDIRRCMMLTISMSNDDDHLHYNSWRSVDATTIGHLAFYRPCGIFVYGAFYWTVFDKEVRKYLILTFNIENEGFCFIRPPKDFENDFGGFCKSLVEIKYKLHFMAFRYHPRNLELWMLSDIKNQLWTQSWIINLQNISHWHELFESLDLIIYRREYLQNYNESYEDILKDFGKHKVENRALVGMGTHTNIFSL